MNIIDVTQIVDPNVQQPFTGKSLHFLQNANIEMLNALSQFIGSPDGGTGTDVYIINGCQKTGAGPYFYSTGYVYDQNTGQMYLFAGGSSASANPNLTLKSTPDTAAAISPTFADPCIFSDGTTHNVHYHYTLELDGAGAVISSFNGLIQPYLTKQPTTLVVGGGGGAAPYTADFQEINSTHQLRYSKDVVKCTASIEGQCKAISTNASYLSIFQLPSVMYPKQDYQFLAYDLTASAPIVGLISASDGKVYLFAPTNGHNYFLGHQSFWTI